ncbi:glycosyltransferase [Neobacillus drentensis]|uniref:glycosyltransferase n=1 Tax=Neobacillus drentensis TaxID=220684 RepID=UPI002FFD885C
MKVIMLSPGKSSHTHKWATFYKQKGIDVLVVTFKDHYSEQNAKEVPTRILPKLLPGKFSYLTSVFALNKIIKEFNPDVVHAHFTSSYGFVGALVNNHPYFVSVWGTDIYHFPQKSNLNRKIIEFTLRKADVVCSTSNIMAEETKKYVNKSIEITPFGVDLALFYPNPHQPRKNFKIGIAKGLEDKYGFKDLFNAFSNLSKKMDDIELIVIGNGPKLHEYKEICRSLGIENGTKFVGQVANSEVPNLIRDLDLVVLPSYEESFGVTAVEAMACGVPVVAYDADGLKEVIIDQKTGILVPMGKIEELSRTIETLLLNEERRKKMGRYGVEHVRQNYNWEENASRVIEIYKEIL